MLENIAFFQTKREKITGLSTLKVGGGENLLRVPTLLPGIVDCTKVKIEPHVKFFLCLRHYLQTESTFLIT